MNKLDAEYWQNRYLDNTDQWNIGFPSPPLKAYIDQLTNKNLKILLPGGGKSYEASYLFESGFSNVYVLDWAQEPLDDLINRCPLFPTDQLLQKDFFELNDSFELIIEQTFFCALPPALREDYCNKMADLLLPAGKLVGLFFADPFHDREGPPFGGSAKEYTKLFKQRFAKVSFDKCYNSLAKRAGRELFAFISEPSPLGM